jgi:hypothetical protein
LLKKSNLYRYNSVVAASVRQQAAATPQLLHPNAGGTGGSVGRAGGGGEAEEQLPKAEEVPRPLVGVVQIPSEEMCRIAWDAAVASGAAVVANNAPTGIGRGMLLATDTAGAHARWQHQHHPVPPGYETDGGVFAVEQRRLRDFRSRAAARQEEEMCEMTRSCNGRVVGLYTFKSSLPIA